MWAMRPLAIIFFLGIVIGVFVSQAEASPRDIMAEMRFIPQNHCLRFRKFDMIRRCRRYRTRRYR